jgi:hypothetical protein
VNDVNAVKRTLIATGRNVRLFMCRKFPSNGDENLNDSTLYSRPGTISGGHIINMSALLSGPDWLQSVGDSAWSN